MNGVQYIVIAVGGNFNGRPQAQFMAFRLSNSETRNLINAQRAPETLVLRTANETPTAAAATMTAELGLQNGEMTTLFRQSLGLDCSEAVTKLLAFVRNTPELPVAYISPRALG